MQKHKYIQAFTAKTATKLHAIHRNELNSFVLKPRMITLCVLGVEFQVPSLYVLLSWNMLDRVCVLREFVSRQSGCYPAEENSFVFVSVRRPSWCDPGEEKCLVFVFVRRQFGCHPGEERQARLGQAGAVFVFVHVFVFVFVRRQSGCEERWAGPGQAGAVWVNNGSPMVHLHQTDCSSHPEILGEITQCQC